jgi:sarcosine oxidase subunit beta
MTPWSGATRQADRLGVDIHQDIEVTGIRVEHGRVVGVETTQGSISCGKVVACTAGWSSQVAAMAGVELPLVTHPLQAFVTEPLKPMLHVILVSATLHVYVSQTDRGEILIGSEIEPYSSYSQSTVHACKQEGSTAHCDRSPVLTRRRASSAASWPSNP